MSLGALLGVLMGLPAQAARARAIKPRAVAMTPSRFNRTDVSPNIPQESSVIVRCIPPIVHGRERSATPIYRCVRALHRPLPRLGYRSRVARQSELDRETRNAKR